MDTFFTMAVLQVQLFLFILIGMILTKTHIITPEGRKSLSDLLIHFILPCNIICSFRIDMDHQIMSTCGQILLITGVCQLFYLAVSKVLFRGVPKEQLACLRYATVCSNAGFLGIPIIGAVYGATGTLLTSIGLIPQRIVMWSAGLSFFTRTSGKDVLRKLLTHPCIIAVVIGFALIFSGNPALPAPIESCLKGASGCTTCLSMLVIGSILASAEHVNLRDRIIWRYTLARLVLIPLAVYVVLALLHVDRTLIGVAVLSSGMPAGSTTAILAARYDGDAPFASCLIFVSTLMSMVTLPLLCLLL